MLTGFIEEGVRPAELVRQFKRALFQSKDCALKVPAVFFGVDPFGSCPLRLVGPQYDEVVELLGVVMSQMVSPGD